MAPLLFTAEEINAGHIDHAIRFILPNDRIQNHEYVRPATHGTGGSVWAKVNGVPYGARFRLKPNPLSINLASLSKGARVIAKAMQKYGMILSDGGKDALTGKSDARSLVKYGNLLQGSDLAGLQATDFEMIDATYGTGTDIESSSVLHPVVPANDYCTRK